MSRDLPQVNLEQIIPANMDQEEYNIFSTFIDECFGLGEHDHISQILAYTPCDISDSEVDTVDSDLAEEITKVSDIESDDAAFLVDDRGALLIKEIMAYFYFNESDVSMEGSPEVSDIASDEEDVELSDSNDTLMEIILAYLVSDVVEADDGDGSCLETIPEVSEIMSDDGTNDEGYLADHESSDEDEDLDD